jgi:hypothetical protein
VSNTVYLIAGSAVDTRPLVKVKFSLLRHEYSGFSALGLSFLLGWVSSCSCALVLHIFVCSYVLNMLSPVVLCTQASLTKGRQGPEEDSVVRSSLGIDVAEYKPYFNDPKVVEFRGKTAYANFYPPTNRDVIGPAGERPPLPYPTFRERIYGQWGIVDVRNYNSCAEYLVIVASLNRAFIF